MWAAAQLGPAGQSSTLGGTSQCPVHGPVRHMHDGLWLPAWGLQGLETQDVAQQ